MRGVISFCRVKRDRGLLPCRLWLPGALRPLLVTRAAAGSRLARTNLVAETLDAGAIGVAVTVAFDRAGLTIFLSAITYAHAISVNLTVRTIFESACTSVLTVFVDAAASSEIAGSAYTYALAVFIFFALLVGSGTLHTAGEGAAIIGPCLRGHEQGKDTEADHNG